MSVKILDQDRGYKDFVSRLKKKPGYVKVGVGDDIHYPSGILSDELGKIHEFGLGHVPSRSFLRAWVDENREDILLKIVGAITNELHGGVDWRSVVGAWAKQEIVQRIWSDIPPALNPETVARKRSDATLIDTKQLIYAITYELGI